MEELLIKLLGRRILFLFGDAAVWDRYKWLDRLLPATRDHLKLLDVGCGNGSFTIEAASRGYDCVGLTWDDVAATKALGRAGLLKVTPRFVTHDVRRLDELALDGFDFIINFENIEHIIDDEKMIVAMSRKLSDGGFLLLTTPYYFFPIYTKHDIGPYLPQVEEGGHVRRGYTEAELRRLGDKAGLTVELISYCTGPCTRAMIRLQRAVPGKLASALFIPLKLLAHSIDTGLGLVGRLSAGSICVLFQKLPA